MSAIPLRGRPCDERPPGTPNVVLRRQPRLDAPGPPQVRRDGAAEGVELTGQRRAVDERQAEHEGVHQDHRPRPASERWQW
jgi:hypothetical protein